MKNDGRFIVIEGIDGAGTSTQVKLLVEEFAGRGFRIKSTFEPTGGPVGLLIRDILEKRIVPLRDVYKDEHGERDTLALLFTSDRMDHIYREIIPAINNGESVVSDRYYHSTCAYQMRDEEHLKWIVNMNSKAIVPDLTIFLDLEPEESIKRIQSREQKEDDFSADEGKDLYETLDQLKRIRASYMRVLDFLHSKGENIMVFDGSSGIEDVHNCICSEVTKLFK